MSKIEEAYEYIVEYGIATEEEIKLVTCINGWNMESMESIIYARTGYRSVEQHTECAL